MDNYIISAIEGFMNDIGIPGKLVAQEWHRRVWGNVYEYTCTIYHISKSIPTVMADVHRKADNDILSNTTCTASAALKELLLQINSINSVHN